MIEDIQDMLNHWAEQINGRVTEKDNEKEGMALRPFVKQYKGPCNTYGKYGHKGVTFPEGKANENGKDLI